MHAWFPKTVMMFIAEVKNSAQENGRLIFHSFTYAFRNTEDAILVFCNRKDPLKGVHCLDERSEYRQENKLPQSML